jgi:hypothetical protein
MHTLLDTELKYCDGNPNLGVPAVTSPLNEDEKLRKRESSLEEVAVRQTGHQSR